MRPRFQADADFNHKIVVGLRRREPSVDFLGAHDGGVVGVPDPEVLRIAAESRPGLIIVAQDLDIGAAIEELLLIWVVTESKEWLDHLGFVPV